MSQLQLDKSTIQSYGVALSEKLVNDFFSKKESIKGEEIVRFTEIEQLNFFILMNLFDRWKDEIGRLKSPYFNYEEEEVALALKAFVNKVSRHIVVRKEFFKPLVQKSIIDTLTYLLNPSEFIEQEINKTDRITKSDLLDKEKFFKLYKDTFQLWIAKVNSMHDGALDVNELIKAYTAVAPKQHVVQYSDPIVDKFNQLLKLTLLVSPPQQANVEKLVKITPPEPKVETVQPKPLENLANQPAPKPAISINDQIKQNSQSGNSIAERLSKSKIEDIKSSIPLNLKFLFINVLFDGKVNEYNDALSHIEQCSDFETTQKVLIDTYSKKNKWDSRVEERDEFFKIIERKFY
ncbi:hypothetical protein [Cytophaga aurantiaca]|uniref:hypothetical protein n=1 Tax=Cytophaga aurantiaca TaxID=29530 RepID=UPI00035FD3FC|nr:hypothetical protein [Cytophaga aurantiaca]